MRQAYGVHGLEKTCYSSKEDFLFTKIIEKII